MDKGSSQNIKKLALSRLKKVLIEGLPPNMFRISKSWIE
jgi:hypothetical protein